MSRKPERKFTSQFLSTVPTSPGVYLIYDSSGALIYIGKAKNLRRRLGQYKNAKRRKKHAKMRSIVKEAQRIEYRTLPSDLDACMEETKLIQEHRPKWNVAGAFYFLYPMIGMRYQDGVARFCYTTKPELFPDFRFHGSYRSRHLTKDAFFALMHLLEYIGHRIKKPSRQTGEAKHSYIVSFRQVPEAWVHDWALFWKGQSKIATETLILSLVENAGARHASEAVQEDLNHLKRFWRHEATRLYRALESTAWAEYPVPQRERDILFLLHSENRKVRKSRQNPSGLNALR